MGILEVLVHTHDIARGLDVSWVPPDELCGPVVERLFPDAPPGPAGGGAVVVHRSRTPGRPPAPDDVGLGLVRAHVRPSPVSTHR